MIPIPVIITTVPFFKDSAKRCSNWLFGARVRPRPGSVMHCALMVNLEHLGVFVKRDRIVELEGEGDIRAIDPDEFLNSSLVRTGSDIYVACDTKTGVVLGSKDIAMRAGMMTGEKRDYNLLLDNCHQFTSGCITGKFENADNLFMLLESTISRKMNRGRPINWLIWNHDEDDEPSEDGLDEQLEEECGELDYELISGHEIACQESVRPELHEELRNWQQQLTAELRDKFAKQFESLELAEHSLKAGNFAQDDIRQDITEYAVADSKADTTYWADKQRQLVDPAGLESLRMALQQEWRRSLERQRNEYYLSEIARRRAEFLKELNGRMIAMQEIADVASELGVEPGLMWDQTKGVGARTDLKILQRWAEYLKNNEGVRRLCDLLGRMRRFSASQRMEMIRSITSYQQSIPDFDARSEVIGITQGRDVEHILPQELALLADADTEILFDLKYAEGRLMSFDYAGTIKKSFEHEQEELVAVEEQDKLGPMIICVDTSGSMSGKPENVAKAIALALSMKSMEQKRNCYLISFSTTIETRDLSNKHGLAELMDFLQFSFGGGTDAAPALNHAIKMMDSENYERADLLMISDFGMPDIPQELKKQMQHARERDCKFYALNIGYSPGFAAHNAKYDHEWQYDPATMGIKELNEIVEGFHR